MQRSPKHLVAAKVFSIIRHQKPAIASITPPKNSAEEAITSAFVTDLALQLIKETTKQQTLNADNPRGTGFPIGLAGSVCNPGFRSPANAFCRSLLLKA
ncbi:hypothetical protein WICMUC_005046 [Wickerhamomyces mucosus]|uniref:Uncharacterized protein n=1 Tax=Wickerhamomyces mucosus TaxID=1378264 RepID=A0A9P8PDB9_9ASCO|nr:hypothetical protein WICMUC_005046 [Wickerhamomyces mucosus]